jgi:hypothetical protein
VLLHKRAGIEPCRLGLLDKSSAAIAGGRLVASKVDKSLYWSELRM